VQVGAKEGPSHLRSSPPTFGETWASKRGGKPAAGGCNLPVRSIKRSLPRRKAILARGPTGSRAREGEAKARDGVKRSAQMRERAKGSPTRLRGRL